MGSRVFLNAKNARTEIVSRAITTGGNIIARGYIEGNALDVKGHLECRGLILGEKGTIYAIPELKGNLAGIDLSHEAAVGKIAEEEVEYLMAQGPDQRRKPPPLSSGGSCGWISRGCRPCLAPS